MQILHKNKIPMYVLSGGIKEVIEASLLHVLQHAKQYD